MHTPEPALNSTPRLKPASETKPNPRFGRFDSRTPGPPRRERKPPFRTDHRQLKPRGSGLGGGPGAFSSHQGGRSYGKGNAPRARQSSGGLPPLLPVWVVHSPKTTTSRRPPEVGCDIKRLWLPVGFRPGGLLPHQPEREFLLFDGPGGAMGIDFFFGVGTYFSRVSAEIFSWVVFRVLGWCVLLFWW